MGVSEWEIIELIKKRNDEGLEKLIVHYGALIRYVIAPILPSVQDREECVSEVAMRIWDKIDFFDERRGSWNGWITTISRNTALNRARASGVSTDEIPDDTPSPELTPEETVIQRERLAELARALEELSQQERALFYRKYYYLQSTSQIASELAMTERAVEGKLYRLKKRLRKALGGEDYE